MTAIKPLQAVCTQPKCRRRQTVPGDRIWYVNVRQGPGSHREAGWRCYACKQENTTPPRMLPKGMVLHLPSRQEVMDRLEAATRAKVAPAPATVPSPVKPAQSSPRTQQAQPRQASSMSPTWAKGMQAKDILIEALSRITRNGGDALALSNVKGRFEPVEITISPLPNVGMADHATKVLQELEEAHADVLVLGGTSNGAPWQVVLHYSAGAACFV